MNLKQCPVCEHEIHDRIGTVCPSCGHTVTYFEGDKRKKRYGKFFAISIFLPFISFVTIIFASLNQITLSLATILYLVIANYSCPIKYNDLFSTKYEKFFFWGIWIVINTMLVLMIYNNFTKF